MGLGKAYRTGGHDILDGFAPRAELELSTTVLPVTSYAKVLFPVAGNVIITWQDGSTSTIPVLAGDAWCIDREYVATLKVASGTLQILVM